MNRLGTGRRGTKDFVLWSRNCKHHEISHATADSKYYDEHFHFEMAAEGYSCTQKNCPVWGNPAGMKMVTKGMTGEETKLLHKRVNTHTYGYIPEEVKRDYIDKTNECMDKIMEKL